MRMDMVTGKEQTMTLIKTDRNRKIGIGIGTWKDKHKVRVRAGMVKLQD